MIAKDGAGGQKKGLTGRSGADRTTVHSQEQHCGLKTADSITLVQSDPDTWEVWLNWYQYGLLHGAEAQRMDDDDLAEFAARIAVANVEVQEDVRDTARRAREFVDVNLAREKRRIANESRLDCRPLRYGEERWRS